MRSRAILEMTGTILVLLLLASATAAAVTPTPAPGDDAMDAAFAGQVEAMGGEITAALNDLSTAFGPDGTREDFPALRAAGSNLSTRARYWHDTLEPMPVTARFTGSKQAMLLGLKEFGIAGDCIVRGVDLALGGDRAAAAVLMREAGVHIKDGGKYFDLAARQPGGTAGPPAVATPPVVVTTPSPVPQPAVTPAATRGPSRTWGRRYAVGNPGTFLGSRSAAGIASTVTPTRRVAVVGPVLEPGSRSHGITPPAAGSFARWYPAARWAAGIR
jgi:hypothetical protein